MSVLRSIVSAVFGHAASSAPAMPKETDAATARSGSTSAPATQPAAPRAQIDVGVVMDKLAAQSKEKNLDWRQSIVDLMKLLDLDSGLGARKQLARELHYTGNMNDTAPMNVWLHQQVMIKLAENGGKVPDDLRK